MRSGTGLQGGCEVDRATIQIKVRPELRARANACAKLEGLNVPEFVRMAIRDACEQSERKHGQRSRAAMAAAVVNAS